MKRVRLALRERTYDIFVGHDIVSRPPLQKLPREKGFVFFDRRIAHSARRFSKALTQQGWKLNLIPLSAGESLKKMKTLMPLYGSLLQAGADRQSVIFAFGGGTIGDAIGFLAGTYMRGVRWVNIPTTLLAQVDSAIGGKTGVNHPIGKNLIGTFYQPSAVLCDPTLLKDLAMRDRISGLGEIVKYGLIMSRPFFGYLLKHWKDILELQPVPTTYAIAQCARFKADIVEKDELDQKGSREILNFGHTIAHALEKTLGYGRLRHGEAVLWGMKAAVALSEIQGHLSAQDRSRIDPFLDSIPLPPLPRGLDISDLLQTLRHDKKARHGKVRFVLLKTVGRTVLDSQIKPKDIRNVLRRLIR